MDDRLIDTLTPILCWTAGASVIVAFAVIYILFRDDVATWWERFRR